MTRPKFYVYVIRDPRPDKRKAPIYVGKGQGRRAYLHLLPSKNVGKRLGRIVLKCRALGLKPIIKIVKRFDNEKNAFNHEISLIAQYGRHDLGLGTLCNLTHGGDGASGWIPSKQFRQKLSRRLRKQHKRDPNYRKAITNGWRKWWSDPKVQNEFSNRMIKLNQMPERRAQISRLGKNSWKSPKRRAVMLAANNKVNSDPALAAIRSKMCIQRNADPNFQKLVQKKRRAWLDKPSTRKAMRESYAKKSSAILNAVNNYWADPKNRKKQAARMRLLNLNPRHQALCRNGRN